MDAQFRAKKQRSKPQILFSPLYRPPAHPFPFPLSPQHPSTKSRSGGRISQARAVPDPFRHKENKRAKRWTKIHS